MFFGFGQLMLITGIPTQLPQIDVIIIWVEHELTDNYFLQALEFFWAVKIWFIPQQRVKNRSVFVCNMWHFVLTKHFQLGLKHRAWFTLELRSQLWSMENSAISLPRMKRILTPLQNLVRRYQSLTVEQAWCSKVLDISGWSYFLRPVHPPYKLQ